MPYQTGACSVNTFTAQFTGLDFPLDARSSTSTSSPGCQSALRRTARESVEYASSTPGLTFSS